MRERRKSQCATQLRAWRTARGYGQVQAAHLLQRPLATYCNWEQGRAMPKGAGLAIVLTLLDSFSQSKRLHSARPSSIVHPKS